MHRTALFLALGTLCAAPVRVDVWTVGPPGSGADFPAVMTAFGAVADGDTLVVLPGTYAEDFDFGRPMKVLGAGPDAVTFVGTAFGGPAVAVSGVGAGEEFHLAGVEIRTTPTFPGENPYGFRVGPNAGTVVFSDLLVDEEGSAVRDTARFLLLASFVSGDAINSLGELAALHVDDSTVWIADSEVRGGPGQSPFFAPGMGNRAVRVVDGTLHLARARLVGGAGGTGASSPPAPVGGSALRAEASTVFVHGGPGCELVGGAGGTTSGGAFASGGPALDLVLGAVVVAQLDTPVAGGLSGNGLEAAPWVQDGAATLVVDPRVFPTLAVVPPKAVPGDSVALDLAGAPGALALPYVAFATGADLAVPGVSGVALLGLSAVQLLPRTSLDGAGLGSVSLAVPTVPSLAGEVALFQWVQVDGPDVAISNPGVLRILP